jgi:hypothetical protein
MSREKEIILNYFEKTKQVPHCYHCKQPMTLEEESQGLVTYRGGMFDDIVHVKCSADNYAKYLEKLNNKTS